MMEIFTILNLTYFMLVNLAILYKFWESMMTEKMVVQTSLQAGKLVTNIFENKICFVHHKLPQI